MRRNAYKIGEFADQLQNFIDSPGPLEQFGLTDPNKASTAEVGKILREAAMGASMMAAVAKEVEFYVHGDINKETFLKRYKALEKKLGAELA